MPFIIYLVTLLAVSLLQQTLLAAESSWSTFDDLRIENGTLATPVFDEQNYIGRNLHRFDFSDASDVSNEYSPFIRDHDSLLLCHIPMFLRYSIDNGNSKNTAQCNIAYSASAGALLAMHHFNNGNGDVVPELTDIQKTCNIRFTSEIFDTTSSPLEAVRQMTRIISRKSEAVDEPQPCAVIGGQISSVTSKLATLSSVFDVFQVSSSAMSTELENQNQYPLLARTHTVRFLSFFFSSYPLSIAKSFENISQVVFFSKFIGCSRFWRNVCLVSPIFECHKICYFISK